MIDEEQVRSISKKVLDEEHLLGFIKIFEKEHNLFRGSHDKIGLPETIVIPQPIVNQIVEKFDTKLTEGSVPFIDENGHFTENNEKLFYDEEKKIFCLGLKNPATDMVGGFCMKAETPPTINVEDAIQVYALDCPVERLTDGGLEDWAGAEDLTYYTEFDGGTPGEGVFREATEVHGGTYSARLLTTAGGDYAGFYQDFTLTPGNKCRVKTWYLRAAHADSILMLYITDPGYNIYLQDDGSWAAASNYLELTESEIWKLFELEFFAHPDYSTYRIRFYKSQSAGGPLSFYVDDVSVVEIGNIIPYFRTSTGIVIGLNQDLRTTAKPAFAGLTLTNFSGVLKAVDGVVNGGGAHADLASISSDQHHPQSHTLASHSTKEHNELTGIEADDHHAQSHSLASHTTKAHSELTGISGDQHHAQLHGSSHHSGGGDAIKLDDLASPDDNLDLNASIVKHGLLKKLGGGTTNFLRADGTWATPPGGASTFLALTDTPSSYSGEAGKFAKVNATPDALVFADLVAGDLPAHSHSRANISDFWGTPFWASIPDKPSTFPPSSHTHVKVDITDTPWAWADVSKTGSNLTDLATRQHAGLTNITSDQHHPQSHTLASHSTKAHSELTGISSGQHHTQLHAAAHHVGGGDLVNHDSLTGFVAAEHLSLPNTIANVLSNHTKAVHDALGLSHDSLADVSVNDHHAQAHTLASHSTKAHSELSDAPADAHHPQSHTLTSHSTRAHSELSDAPANAHHAQLHAATHNSAGGDELNHDNLAGFVAAEHKSLPNTIAQVLSDHTLAVHNALAIDHGSLGGRTDDDHSIYYNAARHTVAIHDALNINADRLDGYHGSDLSTVNTYARRNSSGDIQARLFRSEYDSLNATCNIFMTQIDTVSNNYIRPSSRAQVIASLKSQAWAFTGMVTARDHGTAAVDEVINVCYGTGAPPTANTTTIGTLFIRYTA